MMFAIVSDFPVPGGPSKTKSWLRAEASTATNCELSQLRGVNILAGSSLSSISSLSINWLSCGYGSRGLSTRCLTNIFSFKSSSRFRRSRHIKYLANENEPRTSSSTSSKPACSLTASLTRCQIYGTSIPLSSSGNSSLNSLRFISCSDCKNSINVKLKIGSSSCNCST